MSNLRNVTQLVSNLYNGGGHSAKFSHATYTAMIEGGYATFREMTIRRDAGYVITAKGLKLINEDA